MFDLRKADDWLFAILVELNITSFHNVGFYEVTKVEARAAPF
jgi:hypothetical protein